MSTPKLSIVVPVFGVDKWLPECLNSVWAQTFTAWECILVDDGSRDFSGIICDSFARRDPRFKVIHQRNTGVSAARNAGIEAATAPLLAFVDPDDFLNECYFAELVAEMQRVGADVAISTVNTVAEDGSHNIYKIVNKLDLFITGMPENAVMLNNQTIINGICNNLFTCSSWGKMFRRELWGNTRFPAEINLGEDAMTIPAVIARADKAVCVKQAVYFYRQRTKSLSNGTVSYQRFQKNLYATSVMLDRLCAISPENRERFQKLKLRYDIEGLMYFLRSKPKEAKGKSGLRAMAQGIEDSGSIDVLTPILKRLVE